MRIAFKTIIFLLVFVVGGIALQIWLSKRESRWPGLVLPGLCAAYSLLMVFSVSPTPGMSAAEVFSIVLSVLLISGIPAIVLLAIYAACREKRKRAAQLHKMQVQDLE